MYAVEFETKLDNGMIKIPMRYKYNTPIKKTDLEK